MQVRAPDLDDVPLSHDVHASLLFAPSTLLFDPGGQGLHDVILEALVAVE